jgi:RNA polymerase sigma-70 factor (ECF subfamily)
MQDEAVVEPEALLAAARDGADDCLGSLLQLYRNYLRLLASSQISMQLQTRVNPSDVVQDTYLEAFRDFKQFRGSTEAEFLAWLRRILVNNLARLVERHLLTKKRDVRRDLSLDQIGQSVERSSARLGAALAAETSSPSARMHQRERAAVLADHLARLREQYREVLVLRHLEELPFEEVARRMGRSPGAVRMLWLRAVDELRRVLGQEGVL